MQDSVGSRNTFNKTLIAGNGYSAVLKRASSSGTGIDHSKLFYGAYFVVKLLITLLIITSIILNKGSKSNQSSFAVITYLS
jgi:hypothetical protein